MGTRRNLPKTRWGNKNRINFKTYQNFYFPFPPALRESNLFMFHSILSLSSSGCGLQVHFTRMRTALASSKPTSPSHPRPGTPDREYRFWLPTEQIEKCNHHSQRQFSCYELFRAMENKCLLWLLGQNYDGYEHCDICIFSFHGWFLDGFRFLSVYQISLANIPVILKGKERPSIPGLLEETKRETVESLNSRY